MHWPTTNEPERSNGVETGVQRFGLSKMALSEVLVGTQCNNGHIQMSANRWNKKFSKPSHF